MAISGAAVVNAIIGFVGGTVTFTAALTHVLIASALGAALNALAPKPRITGSGGYSFTGTSGSSLDHQIIYGKAKVGGVRIYDATTTKIGEDVYNTTPNKYLHKVLAFAGHEIESFDEIYVNDELVTLDEFNYVSSGSYEGYVFIKKHTGAPTMVGDIPTWSADSDLVADTSTLDTGKWTVDHTLSNIAYLYVRLQYNADVFPNGVPSISAVVKGKKVYNPKTKTTVWSDNPALCLRDYISSSYGLSVPDSRIDDVSVKAAQDICDQIVTVDSEKRYTCNGAFITGSSPKQIISDIITSMGGLFWYSQGKWRMKAAAYTEPTLTLNEDDLRSGISLSTRHSRRDNFNTVSGIFRGAETDWQPTDYKPVTSASYVAVDNGLVNTVDYSLPFTTSHKSAQRIARLFLNRNREQLTVSASFGLKAFQLEVGDFVYLSNTRFGWTNKVFEVTSWDFGLTDGFDLQVNLSLREISSSVFTEVEGDVFEKNNSTLPSAYYVPAIGITNQTNELRAAFENVFNVIKVTVESEDPTAVERVEVQIQTNIDTLSISSAGTVQTMTFATQTTAPFVVGSYIHVGGASGTGVDPTALNGVFQITSCTTSSVVVSRTTALTDTAVVQGALGGTEPKYWTLVGTGDLGVFETSGLSDGTYSVRARAYNYLGVKGSWFQPDPFILKGQGAVPQSVSNFSYNLSGNNINLQWTPVTDDNLSYYKIRHSSAESGTPLWSDATTYLEKIARPASSVTIPAKAGTYMIRAYNKIGVNSPEFVYIVVPTGSIDTFTNNEILTE